MTFKTVQRVARVAALALSALHASTGRAQVPPTVIDWSKGDIQETSANCGTISLKNLADHHGYSLWVRGTASATCHFTADGLTFHIPSNWGATTQGTTTFFSFARLGSDVLITWTPGY
jgi:hypothetical protein